MGVDAINQTITRMPRVSGRSSTAADCACGDHAATKFCTACALAYCDVCCDKRHGKGAFQRHAIADLPQVTADDDNNSDDKDHARGTRDVARENGTNDDATAPQPRSAVVCDECMAIHAALTCTACELQFCAACADAVHTHGSMQSHRQNGSFQYLRHVHRDHNDQKPAQIAKRLHDEQEQEHASHSTLGDKLLFCHGNNTSNNTNTSHAAASRLASSFFSTDGDDPDQEMSPTPPTKSTTALETPSDPWGSWSARSFASSDDSGAPVTASSPPPSSSSLASPQLNSVSEWRGFRSLSIDGPLQHHDDEEHHAHHRVDGEEIVPLSAIATSLRSLSFASNENDAEPVHGKRAAAQRPRSFSDYTSLGTNKLHDIWNDRVPQLESMLLFPPKPVPSPSSPAACLPTAGIVTELLEMLTTGVASRHVVVKSSHGRALDAMSLSRVLDALTGFGAVASMRDDLASDGVLFCTFFELKAAIGAVKLWFTSPACTSSASSSSSSSSSSVVETSAHFAVPYETPNEINCATLQVQIHGLCVAQSATSSDMRQLCSRYGEVASVLERDDGGDDFHASGSKFLIEFNDARDVSGAIARLSGALLPSGNMLTVTRSHPPTLDMANVHAFLECVDTQKQQQQQQHQSLFAGSLPPPSRGNRPKSYSESTTFLTSPSSTSSLSPLHGSLFDASPSMFTQQDISSMDSDGFLNGSNRSIGMSASSSRGFGPNAPIQRSVSPFAPRQVPMAAAAAAATSTATTTTTATATPWRTREPARPRSSSAFASLSSVASSSSSTSLRGDDCGALSPAQTTRFASQYAVQYRPSHATTPETSVASVERSHGPQPQSYLPNRGGGPVRSGSDPIFRYSNYTSSVASNHSNHSGHSFTSGGGRNDQGAGEYSLSIARVISGDDARTTLMVRNIPNKYTQQMLLSEINAHHHGQYDFFYLPIDFKNKCNMGYAFINFIEAASIVTFVQELDAQKWTNFNSDKVCAISYARLQGKQAMITRFQNSSLLDKHESYRPLVFASSGASRGKPEPFPAPKPQQHPHSHHHYASGSSTKKFPFPGAHHQHALSEEYLLAAHHTGRLYAQHQHQQYVLQGHALLANAHAAAAAMLHNLPGLGMPTTPLPAHYHQQQHHARGLAYTTNLQHHQQHGYPQPRPAQATTTFASTSGSTVSRVSSGGAAFGAFNSAAPSFTPSSSSSTA